MILGFPSDTATLLEQGLRGAATGGAFGLLAGALGGLGYWRIKVKLPKGAYRSGARVLLGVRTNEGRVRRAKRAVLRAGGRLVKGDSVSNLFASGPRA
jgi:hypothetical protein